LIFKLHKFSQEPIAADHLLAVLFKQISCFAVFFKLIICTLQDNQLAKISKSAALFKLTSFLTSMFFLEFKTADQLLAVLFKLISCSALVFK
jgi:hypothetical protein